MFWIKHFSLKTLILNKDLSSNQSLKTNILNLNSKNKKKQSNKKRNNAQFDVSIKHLKQTFRRPALTARVESGATAAPLLPLGLLPNTREWQ